MDGQHDWNFWAPSTVHGSFRPDTPMMQFYMASADPMLSVNYAGRITPDMLNTVRRSRTRSIGNVNSPSQLAWSMPWMGSPGYVASSPYNPFRPLSAGPSMLPPKSPLLFNGFRPPSAAPNSRSPLGFRHDLSPQLPGRSFVDEPQAQPTRAPKFKSSEWESHKAKIKEIFMDEDKSLDETMKSMEEQFSFNPTHVLHPASGLIFANILPSKKQYNNKLRQWKFIKKIPGSTANWMANKARSRKRAGKDTEFTVGDQPWSLDRIEKSASRAKLDPNETYQTAIPSRNFHDAEGEYLQTLGGYEVLLGPTHKDTNTVAYELADLYAQINRMDEADKILEWMSEKHMETWDIRHKNIRAHMVQVADFYDLSSIYSSVRPSNVSGGQFSRQHQDVDSMRDEYRLPPIGKRAFALNNDDGDAVHMDYQVRLAIMRAKAEDDEAENLLLRLLERCERYPEKLAVQILEARTSLVELYNTLELQDKFRGSLLDIPKSLGIIFESETERTELLLLRAIELIQWMVKNGPHEQADALLRQVESEAMKIFEEESFITISVLIHIGTILQDQDRWKDARPRFEQALASSMSANVPLESPLIKNLEDALYNKKYTKGVATPENIRRQAILSKDFTGTRNVITIGESPEAEAMALPSFSNIFSDQGQLNNDDDDDAVVLGLTCEMRTYETRYDSRGNKITLQVGTRNIDIDEHRDHETAFVLTRKYDQYRELEQTTLAIRSPYAKKALQKVVGRYHGIDFHAAVVVLTGSPRCLFHYRKELQLYLDALIDEEAIRHLELLLSHMRRTFTLELETWQNLMESTIVPPTLPFLSLWMAFRPGDNIYLRTEATDRALRLKSMNRCECLNPWCWRSRWSLELEELSFDGEKFGYEESDFFIRPYDGDVKLATLKLFPLKYHPDKDRISRALVARGEKYAHLHGTHHRYYGGAASSASGWVRGEPNVKSRVMIDTKAYYAMNGSHMEHDSELDPEKQDEGENAHARLTAEDFIICNFLIQGFCFTTKRWYWLKVALVEDIDFNTEAFKSLLLPQHQKKMIHSLVKVHTSRGMGFDDLIKGKGKGMVFLLHGVPGTGKTLTAGKLECGHLEPKSRFNADPEGVADYTKRPLYTVSCGELGIDSSSVERNLKTALDLATTWNAIILIDEADIFLEARGPNDLKRNGLVSIFLRLLEYYQGILILTTNRVNVFDPAIKSRIHLAIKYQALPLESRRDLWQVFINRACSHQTVGWLDSECLDRLANEELNGRQIKNAVRTAQALALSDNCELDIKYIDQSLTAMRMFEVDFAEEAPDSQALSGTEHSGAEPGGSDRSSKRRRIS
ncbi:hypothetical protein G7Y89_g4185 [Cudoniella acicularis]|uniref:AAA+ ATPase domain-containing protein n=1 Tax=Cudoniella acicularis TaxID=354080 RepID=A0A8H4RR83_9HELO|nr:hypothetical protein G7Y89_g4185 [Cudoniella acicularis]